MLIVLAGLAGIFLGLSFNVAVLLPMTLAGAAAYAVASAGQGPAMTVGIVISAVSVQAGYMIGLTGRDLFAQLLAWLNIAQSKQV